MLIMASSLDVTGITERLEVPAVRARVYSVNLTDYKMHSELFKLTP